MWKFARMRRVQVLAGGLVALSALAQPPLDDRLVDLSLEDLSRLQITSVSKRSERLSDAPSAVFVITAADIRRSGAASLPEALRLAPNLHVARANNVEYAISARGFNSPSANKLLVLIDGRSVYSPLYSGVFWDVQDVVLEDVDRIEVVSGPGGTLWGVNAVNGVINVITRSAARTGGSFGALQVRPREARLSARAGGRADTHDWRVYALRTDSRDGRTADGTRVDDGGHRTLAGFRAEWQRGADHLTLQGEAYEGRREQPRPGTIVISGVDFALGPIDTRGAHLRARWERRLDAGALIEVQAVADATRRRVVPTIDDAQDLVDLQFQHALAPAGAHRVSWGAQWRVGHDRLHNSPYVAFLPARLDQDWVSLFAQDEIRLRPDLGLTLGLRAERNDYTGVEWLPSARLAWRAAPRQLLWAALSRTVRAPSRLDHDTFVPGTPPFLLRGGPEVSSETAVVQELGYRGQPTPASSLSVSVFHAEYRRLRTQQVDPGFTFVTFANGMRGRSSGLEAWGSLQLSPRWRLHAGYSRLWQAFELEPGSNDAAAVANAEGSNPTHQWMLRSSHDLGAQWELDLLARGVAALALPPVPAYTTLDLRLGWQPRPGTALSFGARNLLDREHGEFSDVATRSSFRRELFVALEQRF